MRSGAWRHREILVELGIDRVVIGIGYRGEKIETERARLRTAIPVDTVYNPDFKRGNIVTLWRMREQLMAGDEVLPWLRASPWYGSESVRAAG